MPGEALARESEDAMRLGVLGNVLGAALVALLAQACGRNTITVRFDGGGTTSASSTSVVAGNTGNGGSPTGPGGSLTGTGGSLTGTGGSPAGGDGGVSPDLTPVADAGGLPCYSANGLLQPGQSTSDDCNTCTCDPDGRLTCTANFCPLPAAEDPCSLPLHLGFDPSDRNDSVDYHYELNPPATFGGTSWESPSNPIAPDLILHCSATLPGCGTTGVVSISTIVQDLTDPEVQAALSAPTRETIYGVDDRPSGGVLWSIVVYGRMGSIRVGSPCPSPATSSCEPIPAGVQRLADDLKSLVALCVWH
jgi:hypothetical protein